MNRLSTYKNTHSLCQFTLGRTGIFIHIWKDQYTYSYLEGLIYLFIFGGTGTFIDI